MRAVLTVEFVTSGKYVEVEKEFDLPFAPFVGLTLQFDGILTNHPNAPAYRQARAKPPGFMPLGIHTIEKVLYDVDEETFHLTAYESFDSVEKLDAAVEQIVLGYGFVED